MGLPDEPKAEGFEEKLEAAREEGISAEQQAEAQRRADFMAHPHTRLSALQTQLTDRRVLDSAAKIGNLQSVLSQLIQIVKDHTPAPNRPGGTDGEG